MRTVVITGVARGLGWTLAERFLARGDQVIGCDMGGKPLERLRNHHPRLTVEAADVADPVALNAFFDAVHARSTAVDVLVNNVGIAGPRAPVEEITLDDWLTSLQTNLTGAFLCIQHVLRGMKRVRRGSIVNVSTGSVRTLPVQRSPYVTSKAALEALTLAVAREAGPFGVRCNAVQPGMMDNERLRHVLARVAEQSGKTYEAVEQEQLQFVATRSMVSMAEVAAMIEYLCSEEARNITGQIVAVDGFIEWEA